MDNPSSGYVIADVVTIEQRRAEEPPSKRGEHPEVELHIFKVLDRNTSGAGSGEAVEYPSVFKKNRIYSVGIEALTSVAAVVPVVTAQVTAEFLVASATDFRPAYRTFSHIFHNRKYMMARMK